MSSPTAVSQTTISYFFMISGDAHDYTTITRRTIGNNFIVKKGENFRRSLSSFTPTWLLLWRHNFTTKLLEMPWLFPLTMNFCCWKIRFKFFFSSEINVSVRQHIFERRLSSNINEGIMDIKTFRSLNNWHDVEFNYLYANEAGTIYLWPGEHVAIKRRPFFRRNSYLKDSFLKFESHERLILLCGLTHHDDEL